MEAVSGDFGVEIAHFEKDRYPADQGRTRAKGGSRLGTVGSDWHPFDSRSPAISGAQASLKSSVAL